MSKKTYKYCFTCQPLSLERQNVTNDSYWQTFTFLPGQCSRQRIRLRTARFSGSMSGTVNLSYEQYSKGNPNCTVSYWELTLGVGLQLSYGSPFSSMTGKGIDSLTTRVIPTLGLSDYLLTKFFLSVSRKEKCTQDLQNQLLNQERYVYFIIFIASDMPVVYKLQHDCEIQSYKIIIH